MTNDISEKELSFGYWYVTHKILLRNIFIGTIFALNVAVWGYVLFSLYNNFVLKFDSYRFLKADLVSDRYTNYESILAMTRPRPIQIQSIQTLPSANNRIDIVAMVKNPNLKWTGHFKYSFVINGGQTETRNGFILPGQQKYLYDLDVDGAEVQNISIIDIDWTRENNFEKLAAERDLFEFKDVKYIPIGTEQGLAANRATFTATNGSNFNYYRPTFVVILKRQGQLVGFNTVTAANLFSHRSQNLESRWFETLPEVDQVEVVADIDYLSQSAYIPI